MLLILALLAVASAAPQYRHHHRHSPFSHAPFEDRDLSFTDNFFSEQMFDTNRFWAELSVEMKRLDEMLADFSKHFPTTSGSEGVEGDEYKVTITLPGFEEKDITVKARTGLLMIQAVHKLAPGSEKSYLDVRTLPANVGVSGSWTYSNDVLKITFPVEKKTEESTEVVTVAPTEQPEHSREEMEPVNTDNVQDIDERGDVDKEVLTNEIPGRNTVEATTYAVDLNNEVEFVPVRY